MVKRFLPKQSLNPKVETEYMPGIKNARDK